MNGGAKEDVQDALMIGLAVMGAFLELEQPADLRHDAQYAFRRMRDALVALNVTPLPLDEATAKAWRELR